MKRTPRNFTDRPGHLQQWFLQHTWCDKCQKADLGMVDPTEYEEDDRVFVEGTCRGCGTRVRSEVREREVT